MGMDMGRLLSPYLAVLILISSLGCSPVYFQPANPGSEYRESIQQWQQRARQEGWSEALVNSIMDSCLRLSHYEPEPNNQDHWKSFGEFQQNFRGDCEDIATFMYGTLKRVGCPYPIKLRIIRMPAGDHAVLMVQLPPERWKLYNTIPLPGDFFDIAMARTVVEWDEQEIYYPQ